MRVRACFGITAPGSSCLPRAVGLYDLVRPSRRAARRSPMADAARTALLEAVAALGQPISPGACTGDVLVDLPLRAGGRPRGLALVARAHGADGRGRDTDAVRLKCTAGANSAAPLAAVLTSDFTNVGSYATITLEAPRRVRRDLGATHADAVARPFLGRLYIVNRLGQDNVQGVNPDTGATLATCSVGNGANPQDIAFASPDKAYVSAFGDGVVRIVDPTMPPTCAGFRIGRIDLGRFADADGTAELGRMAVMDGKLYVAVLRLDRNRGFLPAGRGVVAVVDMLTDTLIDTDPSTPEIDAIALAATNPFGLVVDATSRRLWVWEAGSFFVTGDGGLEGIDPTTNRTTGMIATEAQLGGTITAVAPYTAERAFAIVADTRFRNRLVAFSPQSGAPLGSLSQGDGVYSDVEVNARGEVWLADRALRQPGIRIFDAVTGAPVAGPIDVGLPPFDIVFVR
jgi:DNA-binding beta-propeller fold protein YncE